MKTIYQHRVEDTDYDEFPFGACLILVMLFLVGICYVCYVNAQDTTLIKSCQMDSKCVNPYTRKGLPR